MPSNDVNSSLQYALSAAITPTNWRQNKTDWPADPSDGDEAGEASLFSEHGNEDIHLVIDIFPDPLTPEVFKSVSVPNYARKGIAALALDGQPFGFKHEEREAISACVAASAAGEIAPAEKRKLASLAAAKIFSLLRPRTSAPTLDAIRK